MRAAAARVPIEDRGFLYGDGAFETIRIHRGAPFRWNGHLARMAQSLETLGLAPANPRTLRGAAEKLLREARMADGLLRITLTAPDFDPGHDGHVVLTLRALPEIPERVVLHIAEGCRRVPGPLSRAKTLSRALESTAFREAHGAGAFDAILLNPAGRVVETTARNLFVVAEGVLRTPPVEEGALLGITREAVLEIAKRLGVPASEAPISREDLAAAEEVLLTGSGVGVLGVSRVASIDYAPVPGPWTAVLAEAYRGVLAEESSWEG